MLFKMIYNIHFQIMFAYLFQTFLFFYCPPQPPLLFLFRLLLLLFLLA